MTMNNTKCPTTKGTRAAHAKPPLTQKILFERKLRKVTARQKTFSTKSDDRLSFTLLKCYFQYEEHMFHLTEALQKTAISVQEAAIACAILEKRQKEEGKHYCEPWINAPDKPYLLEVAAKFPSAMMLGDLSLAALCDVAGIVPDDAATDDRPRGGEASDSKIIK